MMRKVVSLFAISALLVSIPLAAHATPPKSGTKCARAKQVVTERGLKYTCTKIKGKLVWSKGVPIPRTSGSPQDGTQGSAGSSNQNDPSSTWLTGNFDVLNGLDLAPKCASDSPLSVSVADLTGIESITPLGFVQADAHNTPVPHLYFNTGSAGGLKDSNGQHYASKRVPIYAPADIEISGVITTTTNPYTEYSVGAHVCGRLWITFNHVDDLIPEVLNVFKNQTNTNQLSGVKIKAGTKIAMSSGRSAGFDFRAMDTSQPMENRLNPKAWSAGWTTAVCGLDWYPVALKDQLYAKLQTKFVTNKCGVPARDIAGTASGAWLNPNFPNSAHANREADTFSLVQTNDDPDQYYFSVGPMISFEGFGSSTYKYRANATGLADPKAENVKSGDVACIDDLIPQGPYSGESYARVYVQPTSAPEGTLETILVGVGTIGQCGSGPFTMPTNAKKFVRYNIPSTKFRK